MSFLLGLVVGVLLAFIVVVAVLCVAGKDDSREALTGVKSDKPGADDMNS